MTNLTKISGPARILTQDRKKGAFRRGPKRRVSRTRCEGNRQDRPPASGRRCEPGHTLATRFTLISKKTATSALSGRAEKRECGLKVLSVAYAWAKQAATARRSSPAKGAWLEFASQSAIFIGPVGAMLLGGGSRWGFVIGLAIQPFWFYTSLRHRQWGIFIASCGPFDKRPGPTGIQSRGRCG